MDKRLVLNYHFSYSLSFILKEKNMKIKKVYLGRKQIYPDGWKPGENTVAYYPLTSTSTVNDMSGNNNTLTNSGITFGTYGGVDCAYCNSNYAYRSGSIFTGNPTFTASAWFKKTGSGGQNIRGFGAYNYNYSFALWFNGDVLQTGGWSNDRDTGFLIDNNWHNVIWTYSSNSGTVYVDGNSVYSGTWSPNIQNTRTTIGSNVNETDKWKGYLSEIIFEDKVRTAQEISNYFNKTKSKYGL